MKPDSERKVRYLSDLHKKRDFLHVHLTKELRQQNKKRAQLVKKGDKVRIMIGKHKKKEAKVIRIKYNKGKVYLEGMLEKNARGKEVPFPFQPSNLMIVEIASGKKQKLPKVEGAKEVEPEQKSQEIDKKEAKKKSIKKGEN